MSVLEQECGSRGIDTYEIKSHQDESEVFEKAKYCIYQHETRSTRKEQFKW